MTFEWEDITDEVREKIVFINFIPPSLVGFIERTPQITAITEDGQEYFAKTERIFLEKRTDMHGQTHEVWMWKSISKTIYEVRELFLGEEFNGYWEKSEKYPGCREKGKWLHTYTWFRHGVFIRKDFYERFFREWDRHPWLTPCEVARGLLNPQGKLPILMHSETPAILEDEERLQKAQSGQTYDQQE